MARTRGRYQIIAMSLFVSDVTDVDRITTALRAEGWPNASRSFVLREALARLSEDLRGMTNDEIFRNFIERRGARIPRGPKADVGW
jgi:hypothetical protein